MLTNYIRAAMRRAKYEILEDCEGFYGHVPELPGAWANADTLEACREQLEEVVEEWILLGIADHDTFPVLDGIELKVTADVG